jgi:hypothetical protein
MALRVGNFTVKDAVFGSKTQWQDGVLEIDADEVVELLTSDPNVSSAEVHIARPGDTVRIANIRDVLEPKVKVSSQGMAYPGVAGRLVDTVGRGTTHRLDGFTVMACAETPEIRVDGSRRWGQSSSYSFVDMSGPGSIQPYASLVNLCLEMKTDRSLDADTWNRAIQAGMLRVQDRLAQAVADLAPPSVEEFDLTPRPDLPGFVFIPHMASPEHRMGPTSSLGTAVYGITRLTPPWLLEPTEMLDGAVFGTYGGHMTWPLTNSIVQYMCRCHGKDMNFLGCIVVRTNWEAQAEKQLMANRATELALKVGAKGAIVTINVRGQRFVEAISTAQACERAGLNVVFLTEEEDNEDGNASPLLVPAPEVVTVVSTGTGSAFGPFPPVKKVIGGFGNASWAAEQPAVHGRYGVTHTHDVYGFTYQSCVDY